MKTFIKRIILFSVVGLLSISCANVRTFSINRVRHIEPSLSSIPIDAFTILGEVSGSGDVSSIQYGKDKMFDGDTGLYGSLDGYDAVYLNLPNGAAPKPATPFDAALANAIYNMIEEAEKLNADVVLFVRTKTKVSQTNGIQEVSVSVRGVAAKLK